MSVGALYITVGIPGCGKSTFIESRTNDEGWTIISTDLIRQELTGDMSDQSRNDEVFEIFYERIRRTLEAGWPVIVDATNLRQKYRDVLLGVAYLVGVEHLYAYRFAISNDFETCQQRNLSRGRVVPEDVMRRFHKNFLEECDADQLEREGWQVLYPTPTLPMETPNVGRTDDRESATRT